MPAPPPNAPSTRRTTSLRQRLFARFNAGMDACSHEMYKERKHELLAPLRGTIVEIGPGTGVNLQFLHPQEVRWIGIEPNKAMHPHIYEKAQQQDRDVTIIESTLDDGPIDDESIDAVISTLVLCSVPSVPQILQQIQEILKPGGTFVFIEHVGDIRWTSRWMVQKSMPFTPWRYFSDGCNPARNIARDINNAGFSEVECEHYMQPGTGIIAAINRPHIAGVAVR